jgi:hypothetical protein
MSDSKVIPFRKRPPSQPALDVFRRMTQNWSPEMQRLLFPEHVRSEHGRDDKKP